MIRPRSASPSRRAGIILVLVVAMLSLALSLGLAFVFYANQQAIAMRIHREAAQGGRVAHVQPTARSGTDEAPPLALDLAGAALGQLIYDSADDDTGIGSGLRGSSLARTMYGLHYEGEPQAPRYAGNDVAYNGIGRARTERGQYVPALLSGVDDANIKAVNYTYFAKDGFLRDPERIGYRSGPQASAWEMDGRSTTRNYFPLNAPYTYPDEKDLYLAAVRPSDGRVLVPSFYRPSTFGPLSPDNPNWTNAAGKYMIQRPRPADMGPGFPAIPANADGSYTGDIEQLEGKQVRQNDSLWMDLDLPIRSWRGRHYKPLVAFLVVDLDGRINVNVAGNRRGVSNGNASNQGIGSWEADPQAVLPYPEAVNLYKSTRGRYGADEVPNRRFNEDGTLMTGNAAAATFAPFYAALDYDGSTLTASGVRPRMMLPQAPSTRTSPLFPARYAQASDAERRDHPSLANPYLLTSQAGATSTSEDRVFGPNEIDFLNRKFNGDEAACKQAQLGQLLPQSLAQRYTPAQKANPRFLLTTISNDIDTPGLVPFNYSDSSSYRLDQPAAGGGGVYPPAGQPSAVPQQFPALSQRPNAVPAGSSFDAMTWKAKHAVQGVVDLRRPLPDYRGDPAKPYEEPGNVTADSSAKALDARQKFARDIFDRLCVAVGASSTVADTGTQEFNAQRYLAQVAVNIVDYLDSDDCVTSFMWNPLDAAQPRASANFSKENLPSRVVFGTELPRLVINEGCMRVENGSIIPGQKDTDPGLVPPLPLPLGWLPKATFYNVKCWAELHNPLTPGTAFADNLSFSGGAALTFDGHQVYRLLLTEPNKRLRHVDNVKGDPDGAIRRTIDLQPGVYDSVKGVIPPSNGAYIQPRGPRSSFYVIAPEPTPGDLVIPSAECEDLKFRLPPDRYQNGEGARTTMLLQRLACPFLPPGDDNPYLTVDIMDFTTAMVNDSRLFSERGLIIPPPLEIILQKGFGRKQPYAGHPSQVVAQNLIPAPVAGFNHTYFRHNGQGALITESGLTLTQPFDWLAHLDREPVNVIDLTNVSGCRPHELTQQFITETGRETTKQQHLANWSSDAYRLRRALELLSTRSRTPGMPTGGRVPGRVNINTIWDEKIFEAIAAANSANHFTSDDVRNIWQQLSQSRTPAGSPSQNAGQDRPFRPTSSAIDIRDSVQYPRGSGIDDTILRTKANDGSSHMIDLPQDHPALKQELLGKIYPQLTTRSNVFAVWMTIGYFEVTDRNTRPAKLGRELGSDDGSNVRHRYFAIVDRTNLTTDNVNPRVQGGRPILFAFTPKLNPDESPACTPGEVSTVVPATSYDGFTLRGVYDDAAWELRTGDRVLIGQGDRRESVPITVVGFSPGIGATLKITCGKEHPYGSPMMIDRCRMGNPGPQPGFSIRDPRYAGVVRLFSTME